jgi:hypothetical protein
MMRIRLLVNHNICTQVVIVVMETILGLSNSSERARVALYDAAMRRYHITENGIRFLQLCSKLDDLTDGEKEEKEEVQF